MVQDCARNGHLETRFLFPRSSLSHRGLGCVKNARYTSIKLQYSDKCYKMKFQNEMVPLRGV